MGLPPGPQISLHSDGNRELKRRNASLPHSLCAAGRSFRMWQVRWRRSPQGICP